MIDFEALITKHAGEDGNIPADAISKAANAIASAVGREFVAKDRYAAKLDEIEQLKTEKQNAEDSLTTANKWKDKYDKEHEAFEKYKSDTDAKETLAAKKAAYKKLLDEQGIDSKRHEAIIRATVFDNLTLDKDGTLTNADELKKSIDKDWADFKVTTHTEGAKVENPPANNGPAKRTKAEIMAIKDTKERQQAIAENHEMFGF